MPTSAKLIGGVCLALTAVYSCYLFMIAVPDTIVGLKFYGASGLIGLVVGWRSIGGDPGLGGVWSFFSGLRGAVLLAVSTGIIFGGWDVVVKLESFFIKSFSAIIDTWVATSMVYFKTIATPEMALALIGGGCISGIAAGLANRFWD